VRHLLGGGQWQCLFGPQDIEMAEARRQNQREQRQEKQYQGLLHDANRYGTLIRQPIGSMIGK